MKVVIATIVVLYQQVIDRQVVDEPDLEAVHVIHWISHVEHDQLAADPSSDGPHKLRNEAVDLVPGLLEEVERRVPDNAVQLFLPYHSLNQANSLLIF